MSKVNISYDTETKALDVIVNDKKVENIGSISIYGEKEKDGTTEYYINIYTGVSDGDVTINTTYYVMSSLQNQVGNEDTSIAGFLGVKEDKITKSLIKLLGAF